MSQVKLNQNQFDMTPVLGQVSMVPNPNVVPVRLNPSSTAVLQAGSAVKLIAGAGVGNEIVVDACSGPTDGPVFGVIVYNMRKNLYSAGDNAEVAGAGSYVFLEPSASVARGGKVTSTAATLNNDPTVATVSVPSTQYVTGEVIDPAPAAGGLVRVKIAPSLNGAV